MRQAFRSMIKASRYIFGLIGIELCFIALPMMAQTYTLDQIEQKGTTFYVKETQQPLTGTLVRFYPNGKPFTKSPFQNGVLHGKAQGFTPDGQIDHVLEYKNNQKHGLLQLYDTKGMLCFKATFQHDKLHGLVTTYYPSGQPKLTEMYDNGVLNGKRTYYNSNGQIQKTCTIDEKQTEICP